jgi:acetate kinase
MAGAVLVVNAGSSSLKFSAYAADESNRPSLLLKGQLESMVTRPRLIAHDSLGNVLVDRLYDVKIIANYDDAVGNVSSWLATLGRRVELLAAGHRVVHGGANSAAAALIDDDVLAELEKFVPLVPLHQPANLAGIRAIRRHHPTLPQVACFDTAFHRGHSEVVQRFALPENFYREGIRRYGFHGLSYEYIAGKLPEIAPEIASGRVIVAHLGSGASLCAMKDGKSVDTTMAFSSLDGLPMATRCGAIDPGVLIYLIRERGMPPDEVEHLLYYGSGLRGISGLSSDLRDLLASDDRFAKLALEYFIHHVCRHVGALTAVLEGLEAIVFTAGIGENSPEIRERICSHLSWLGLSLDEGANQAGGPKITAKDSRASAWVVPTDEEWLIARHTLDLTRPLHRHSRSARI